MRNIWEVPADTAITTLLRVSSVLYSLIQKHVELLRVMLEKIPIVLRDLRIVRTVVVVVNRRVEEAGETIVYGINRRGLC